MALHYSKLKIVVRIANKNCGPRARPRFGSVITNIHMAPGGKIGKQTRDRWLYPFGPRPPRFLSRARSLSLPPVHPGVRRPLFPTDRIYPLPRPPFPHLVGVVFYRDAANYHCKRPLPVKVAERMGFRYDFQKKKKNKKTRKSRGKTERTDGRKRAVERGGRWERGL